MAALDFPASPVNGQVFSAPNGVSYVWSATYTAWQALPLSSGFVGDFCATSTSAAGITTTNTVMLCPTIQSGNAGGWYNPVNGRFTPPKGRYVLYAMANWYSSSASIGVCVTLRKNGTTLITPEISEFTMAANIACQADVQLTIDANGTDYYEALVRSSGPTPSAVTLMSFSAVPVSPNANMVQGTGDFFAASALAGLPASFATLTPTTQVGNAGGWYNGGNGRWTPPAGRYYVWGGIVAGLTSGATFLQVVLRKNGVNLYGGYVWSSQTPATANWVGDPMVSAIVDMNGTDYIEIAASANNGVNYASMQQMFGAFPLSGIKGPQGDPGAVGQAGANAFNIRTTTQGFTLGNNYTALFRSEATPVTDYDPDGVISTVAADARRFTAPNAGRYHMEAHAYLYHNVNGQGALIIRHTNSGGTLIRQYTDAHFSDTTGYGSQFAVSVDIQMAAGDRIDWWYATGGSCYPIPSGNISGSGLSQLTYACGHRIS